MNSRRGFLKDLATVGGGLSLLDAGKSQNNNYTEEEALEEFEFSLQHSGELNEATTSIERKEDESIYTLGLQESDKDLYAVALSDHDEDFVDIGRIEGTLKDVALWTATAGNRLAQDEKLPNDQVTVYSGITGRNNSFLPLKLDFEEGEDVDIGSKSEQALQELKCQTRATDDELLPYQEEALQQLEGFDSAYEDRNRIIVVENIDGFDNNYDQPGEFILDKAEYAELANTRTEGEDAIAELISPESMDRDKKVGDSFNVGSHSLEVSYIDPEAGYVELEAEEEDYDSIDNAPFIQASDEF